MCKWNDMPIDHFYTDQQLLYGMFNLGRIDCFSSEKDLEDFDGLP